MIGQRKRPQIIRIARVVEDKDDLLTAALLSLFDGIEQATVAALGHCATASAKLQALADTMVAFGEMAEGMFAMFLEYWASSPRREEAAKVWVDLLVEYKDVVVDIIEEGVRNGEFRPVDAEGVVWAMMAAYDGLAAYALLMPDLDLARISSVFAETLVEGLLAGR